MHWGALKFPWIAGLHPNHPICSTNRISFRQLFLAQFCDGKLPITQQTLYVTRWDMNKENNILHLQPIFLYVEIKEYKFKALRRVLFNLQNFWVSYISWFIHPSSLATCSWWDVWPDLQLCQVGRNLPWPSTVACLSWQPLGKTRD